MNRVHVQRYLWEKLDQGKFRPVRIDDELVYSARVDGGPLNPTGSVMVGEDVVGPLVVTPKVLNQGLYSGLGL